MQAQDSSLNMNAMQDLRSAENGGPLKLCICSVVFGMNTVTLGSIFKRAALARTTRIVTVRVYVPVWGYGSARQTCVPAEDGGTRP
jgi:hypothetical protein